MTMDNYKVYWIGTVDGYGIDITNDDVNDHDVFKTFREAKNRAIRKSDFNDRG